MTDVREGNETGKPLKVFKTHLPLSFLLLFTGAHMALGCRGHGPGRHRPVRQRPAECSQDGRAPQEWEQTDAESTSPTEVFSATEEPLHGVGWDEAHQTTLGSGLAVPSKGEGGHPSTQQPLHSRPEEPSSGATCTHTGALMAVCSPHPHRPGKWISQPLCIHAIEPIGKCNFK